MKQEQDKDCRSRAISRRAFIKGAGAVAAVTGLVHAPVAAPEASDAQDGIIERIGPGPHIIELKINGRLRRLAVEPRVTLARALREHLNLTGTKLMCDRGACGACTVHIDGRPVNSCMILAVDARGREITTVEGLGSPAKMHPLQHAFVEHDAVQCGFCTPGMLMSLAAALKSNPNATLEEIKRATTGNICRCGTYPHVFEAALKAAGQLRRRHATGA